MRKQKSTEKFSAFYLAPQPGLEPGTYGLTENYVSEKPILINDLYG